MITLQKRDLEGSWLNQGYGLMTCLYCCCSRLLSMNGNSLRSSPTYISIDSSVVYQVPKRNRKKKQGDTRRACRGVGTMILV